MSRRALDEAFQLLNGEDGARRRALIDSIVNDDQLFTGGALSSIVFTNGDLEAAFLANQ
jgi:hypothetical protein